MDEEGYSVFLRGWVGGRVYVNVVHRGSAFFLVKMFYFCFVRGLSSCIWGLVVEVAFCAGVCVV